MADDGYNTPTGKIVLRGTPPVQIEKKTAVATIVPGYLVKKGTTDYDCDLNDGISPVIGFAGYEQSQLTDRPENIATAWASGDEIPVIRGPGFTINATLAKGFKALQGDALIPWGSGTVAPAVFYKGAWCVRIPFTKNTSETDTNVDLPSGINVVDCWVKVNTEVASGTIDVGLLSSEASGDADGFLDGESCATAGIPDHEEVHTTQASLTLGVLLVEADLTDATGGGAQYHSIRQAHVCDGTTVSVSYTTSNHDIAGDILLAVAYDGIMPVGKAGISKTNTTAVSKIPCETV